VSEAKRRAIHTLQTIRTRVSSAFANIVEGLLEWETPLSHLRTETHVTQDRVFVQDVLSALHKLERDLVGTVATPLPTIPTNVPQEVADQPDQNLEDPDRIRRHSI